MYQLATSAFIFVLSLSSISFAAKECLFNSGKPPVDVLEAARSLNLNMADMRKKMAKYNICPEEFAQLSAQILADSVTIKDGKKVVRPEAEIKELTKRAVAKFWADKKSRKNDLDLVSISNDLMSELNTIRMKNPHIKNILLSNILDSNIVDGKERQKAIYLMFQARNYAAGLGLEPDDLKTIGQSIHEKHLTAKTSALINAIRAKVGYFENIDATHKRDLIGKLASTMADHMDIIIKDKSIVKPQPQSVEPTPPPAETGSVI